MSNTCVGSTALGAFDIMLPAGRRSQRFGADNAFWLNVSRCAQWSWKEWAHSRDLLFLEAKRQAKGLRTALLVWEVHASCSALLENRVVQSGVQVSKVPSWLHSVVSFTIFRLCQNQVCIPSDPSTMHYTAAKFQAVVHLSGWFEKGKLR